jgi:phosphatidylglycerol---prolipoprotein diacylglyceryl transferase
MAGLADLAPEAGGGVSPTTTLPIWPGRRVSSYRLLVYLGLVIGLAVENRLARVAGLDGWSVFAATLLLLVPTLVGARLLFVATHWAWYHDDLQRIWRRSEGGAALHGGVVLGALVSIPILAAFGLPFGAFWDIAASPMLIGAIFTRFGCVLHGCCAGRPTERGAGLVLPDVHGVWRRRVPTQLIEIGVFGLLLALPPFALHEKPFDGALYLWYLGLYGLTRWALDFTREERIGRRSLTVSHLDAAAMAIGCGIVLLLGTTR